LKEGTKIIDHNNRRVMRGAFAGVFPQKAKRITRRREVDL
jgi:hypothetical protein